MRRRPRPQTLAGDLCEINGGPARHAEKFPELLQNLAEIAARRHETMADAVGANVGAAGRDEEAILAERSSVLGVSLLA